MATSVALLIILTVSSVFTSPTYDFRYTRNYNFPRELHEDAKLLVPELIRKYGYPCEEHTVQTSDGYILKLHRIPHGRAGPSEGRSSVLLNHGLLSSSADWVLPGLGNSLPYKLADAGLDVWMLNARGTRYSRKHITLDPDAQAKKFWDFSFHEIGVYDVPTTIDYILEVAQQNKIVYIGHSQGTTTSYVLLSEIPEYNEKLSALVSLAPSAFANNIYNPIIKKLAPMWKMIEMGANLLGMHEIIQTNERIAELVQKYCSNGSKYQPICVNFLFIICGFSPEHMDPTFIPITAGHTPAGASTKQFVHYAQDIETGNFRQYDHGRLGNIKRYGTATPPDYKLDNIKIPVHLFYSKNDWLSSDIDTLKLHDLLSDSHLHLVANGTFNHIDYLYAIGVGELLHDDIVSVVKTY